MKRFRTSKRRGLHRARTARVRDFARVHVTVLTATVVHALGPSVVIVTEEGPIPLPVAIPHEAPHLTIPHGPHYEWADVKNWGKTVYQGILTGIGIFEKVAGVTIQDVHSAIDAAMTATVDIIGSFTNYAVDYTATVSNDLHDLLDTTQGYFLGSLSYVFDAITYLQSEMTALERRVIAGIDADVRWIEGWVDGQIDNLRDTLVGIVSGVVLDVLYRELAKMRRYVDGTVDGATQLIKEEILRIERADFGDLLRDVTYVAALLAAVTQWIERCGQPMCDEIGPGTNFKSLWDSVKALLGVLAGIELANLTEHDLENIAARFASISAGAVEDFGTAFLDDGATVGHAGADLLGDLTGVVADVLREVGVPIP